MPKFSVIIPVFNRPEEVKELLQSLVNQEVKDFEVLIIEDGSTLKCKEYVEAFKEQLEIHYFYKENSGQGFSRNYGFSRAKGEWLVVFDSDCIIPSHYFKAVEAFLIDLEVDAFGGPDKAHSEFNSVQKAISYSMTSFFTTGGIRGGKKHIGTFHPRSFNMGIKKEVFDVTKGYILPKKGEDIEFSIRIIEHGFKTVLIPDAFVYHKRRTNFLAFFKQLHFFGTARINVFRFYRKELKLVHFFPSIFFLGLLGALIISLFSPQLGTGILLLYGGYFALILLHAIFQTKSLWVGILSVWASLVQLSAYGIGLISEGWTYLREAK